MEVVSGVYRHFKGSLYRVITLAKLEATNEDVVVYETFSGQPIKNTWVRPLSSFTELVVWSDGVMRPRFILVPTHELSMLQSTLPPRAET